MNKKPTASRQSELAASVVQFPADEAIAPHPPEWLRARSEKAAEVWQRFYRLLPAAARVRRNALCFEMAVNAMIIAREKNRVSPARALSIRSYLLEMLIEPASHSEAFSDLRLTKASAAALFGEPLRELSGIPPKCDSDSAPSRGSPADGIR